MLTLASEQFLIELIENENFIVILAIVMGCLTGMVGILCGMIGTVVKTRSRETTRRELSAYVAEGSMNPEEAVRIMNAGRPKWEAAEDGKA